MLPSSSGHQISEGVRFIPSESIKKERPATMRTRLHWEWGIWGIKGSPAAAVQAGQPQPRIPIPSLTGTGIPAVDLRDSHQGKKHFSTVQQTLINHCGKWLQAGFFGRILLSSEG